MTTITGSSSNGSYVDQLLGVNTSTATDTGSAIIDAINAANKTASAKATDSSSATSSQLGLSSNVIDLLQGVQGAAYMKQMLDTGTSSPVTALLGGSVSNTLLASALSGARQKQYNNTLSSNPIGSLIDANNAIANAANKAYLASISSASTTGTTVNTTDTSSSGGTSASGSGTEISDPYTPDPTS